MSGKKLTHITRNGITLYECESDYVQINPESWQDSGKWTHLRYLGYSDDEYWVVSVFIDQMTTDHSIIMIETRQTYKQGMEIVPIIDIDKRPDENNDLIYLLSHPGWSHAAARTEYFRTQWGIES